MKILGGPYQYIRVPKIKGDTQLLGGGFN